MAPRFGKIQAPNQQHQPVASAIPAFTVQVGYGSGWEAIASKIGCRVQGQEPAALSVVGCAPCGHAPGATTDEGERIKTLARENREIQQANMILRKASTNFAQAELDRRFKR